MLRVLKRALIAALLISLLLFSLGYYRTRMLRDSDGPHISVEEASIVVSVGDGEDALLRGIRAIDRKDGDVTASLVLQGLSNFVEKGRRQMTVAAFDSDNNVSKATRDIVYSDYVSPRFSLERPLSFPIGTLEAEIVKAVHVEDCLDGDLSREVAVEMENPDAWLDTTIEGTSRLTFTVVNSAGDVGELTLTVQIYNSAEYNRGTSIQLSQYLVYLDRYATFDPWHYILGMQKYGEAIPLVTSQIQISNPVDTAVPGVYEVLYSVSDEDSETVTQLRLPVIVE